MSKIVVNPTVVDPELDPALEQEFYEEPSELKARLDIEEDQGPPPTGR
jgi:hypothetical protein